MATNKKATIKKSIQRTSTNSAKLKEIKIVVELNIPQLDENRVASPSFFSRLRAISPASPAGEQKATVTIKPVQDVHIVDLEVNAVQIAKDTDVQKDNTFSASKDIFPTRPVSLFVHITGNPNTMIEITLNIGDANEFKGNLFIPVSGTLAIQKNIA